MKRFICTLLILVVLSCLVSCNMQTTVSVYDYAMIAYEGDQPATEFDLNFPADWGNETIQKYLNSYEPITVHKGDILTLEIDDATLDADAFRVCYVDANGNEIKHTGNIELIQRAFSDDYIEIHTDWWYEDSNFAGQYATWAYWIAVSAPNEINPTRIYYLRLQFE